MSEFNNSNIFNDVTESFKSVVLERFTSPLLFSFSVSWSIINYKFYLIVFTKSTIQVKLQLLTNYFANLDKVGQLDFINQYVLYSKSLYLYDPIVWITDQTWLHFLPFVIITKIFNLFTNYAYQHTHTIFLPFVFSLIYVFLYPIINRRVLSYIISRKKLERGDRLSDEKLMLFTYEDVSQIYTETTNEIQRYSDENKRLKNQNASLSAKIETLNTPSNNPTEIDMGSIAAKAVTRLAKTRKRTVKKPTSSSILQTETSPFNATETSIIIALGTRMDKGFEAEISDFRFLGLSQVLFDYTISKLTERGYIRDYRKAGRTMYTLTSDGMEIYLKQEKKLA